jgi:hypothetical protein
MPVIDNVKQNYRQLKLLKGNGNIDERKGCSKKVMITTKIRCEKHVLTN